MMGKNSPTVSSETSSSVSQTTCEGLEKDQDLLDSGQFCRAKLDDELDLKTFDDVDTRRLRLALRQHKVRSLRDVRICRVVAFGFSILVTVALLLRLDAVASLPILAAWLLLTGKLMVPRSGALKSLGVILGQQSGQPK